MSVVIKVENVSKRYHLGKTGTNTLKGDFQRWWARKRGKEDPFASVVEKAQLEGEEFWALKDINFEVRQGEALGIIGKNGAGKSTLLKLLSRITLPTTGSIKVKGRIASLLEVGTGFNPDLTGRENIYLNGAILGMTKAEITKKFDEIVDFSGIERFIDTPVKRYSSGMYVRLAFAVAAHLESEILILDEVLAVGDAEFQKKCLGKMDDVAHKQGRTILFVSHNMAAVENLCNNGLSLKKGLLEFQGDIKKAINLYLTDSTSIINSIPLYSRTDRQGNGDIKLTSFHLEDSEGRIVNSVRSGMDVDFVLSYQCTNPKTARNVDIGISFHTTNNHTIGVLYSSYQGYLFNNLSEQGEFRLNFSKFFLSAGRYRIGARILINRVEADWPQGGIAFLNVEGGDFYGTGNKGFEGPAPVLFTGDWRPSTISI